MIRRIHALLDARAARSGLARKGRQGGNSILKGVWMSKRVTTALLALAFALTFLACGKKEEEEEEAAAPKAAPSTAAAGAPAAAPAAPAAATGSATITGKVAFAGTA